MADVHCCFIKYRFSLELMEKGRSNIPDEEVPLMFILNKDGMIAIGGTMKFVDFVVRL